MIIVVSTIVMLNNFLSCDDWCLIPLCKGTGGIETQIQEADGVGNTGLGGSVPAVNPAVPCDWIGQGKQ